MLAEKCIFSVYFQNYLRLGALSNLNEKLDRSLMICVPNRRCPSINLIAPQLKYQILSLLSIVLKLIVFDNFYDNDFTEVSSTAQLTRQSVMLNLYRIGKCDIYKN